MANRIGIAHGVSCHLLKQTIGAKRRLFQCRGKVHNMFFAVALDFFDDLRQASAIRSHSPSSRNGFNAWQRQQW